MRRLLLIPLLAMLAPFISAQRMASAARPHFAARFHDSARPRSSFFYPLGLSDPFYADYLPSTGYGAASPPVFILQPPATAAPAPAPAPPPVAPLMIELRGDRYVQVSGPDSSGAEMISPEKSDTSVEIRLVVPKARPAPRSTRPPPRSCPLRSWYFAMVTAKRHPTTRSPTESSTRAATTPTVPGTERYNSRP